MTTRLVPRAKAARFATLFVNGLSRTMRRGEGTVAGGRVGLHIDPQLLRHLSADRTIVAVSGTNGKTTTSALLRAALGDAVGGNVTGANMPAGHVAALASSSAMQFVLEVDEAWLPHVVRESTPRVVCLLNLSRDQLDRASEVRQIAERWRSMASEALATAFVANASDPLIVDALSAASNVTWVSVPSSWHADSLSCPRCTAPLRFGDRWECSCGLVEPLAAWRIDAQGSISTNGETIAVALSLPGLFNRVNAAFALAACQSLGLSVAEAASRLASLETVQGRYGIRRFGNRQVRLLLAKNPAGVAALLDEAGTLSPDVWVSINAQVADGKDPSWLYDAPFERLVGHNVSCLGERRLDLATRLEVDGIASRVVDDAAHLDGAGPLVTIIANYTAFQSWIRETTPW